MVTKPLKPIVSRAVESGGIAEPEERPGDLELPSVRIDRLTKELEDLRLELLDLEKEEIPTRMAKQA